MADLHAQLVEQVSALGDQIGEAGDAIQNAETPQEIQQAASQLQSAANGAGTELSSLIDQINQTLQG